ncbi:MAG: radical SAM protein [bacterium]|nr:radical SAM protein [bacterium]
MKVSLISPPFVDPRAPYLAVASLTAFLRAKGHQVIQTDLNVLSLSSLLSAAYLSSLFGKNNHPALEFCMEHVDQAVANLRDPSAFCNFQTYIRSRNILDLTLRCISSRYPGVDLNLRRITSYDGTLGQIIASVLQGKETPFDPVYLDEFVPEILAWDPDIVGISVSNGSQLLPALKLSMLLKARGARTILGGPVITRTREEIASTREFFEVADGAIIYEGEEALQRLVDNLAAGEEPFSGVRNCIYRDGVQIVMRDEPFALNLNSLPTPDFEGLPLKSYFAPYPVLPLLSAKGCSWGLCTFCTIPDTSNSAGTRIRERTITKVIEDLASLKRKFGARHFVFVDENISADRLERLGRAMIDAKLDVLWLAYSRFEKGHTPDRCQIYYAAGCRKLLMGLESASPRILRLMRKGITPDTVHNNLTCLHEAAISVNVFCMLGFPSETREEMNRTMGFVRDRRSLLFKKGFSANFAEFVLDKASAVDHQPEEFGLAKGDRFNEWKFVGGSTGVNTPASNEVRELGRRFNAELRDLFYPNEMIGWEEYTLLYEDSKGECRFPWRKPTQELVSLVRGAAGGSLVLRKRPYRVVEALLPQYRRREGEARRSWLINLDSAYALLVGQHVTSFLEEVDGHSDLDAVIGRFGLSFQREPSAVRESCLALVENLWKHGYLEQVSTPAVLEIPQSSVRFSSVRF